MSTPSREERRQQMMQILGVSSPEALRQILQDNQIAPEAQLQDLYLDLDDPQAYAKELAAQRTPVENAGAAVGTAVGGAADFGKSLGSAFTQIGEPGYGKGLAKGLASGLTVGAAPALVGKGGWLPKRLGWEGLYDPTPASTGEAGGMVAGNLTGAIGGLAAGGALIRGAQLGAKGVGLLAGARGAGSFIGELGNQELEGSTAGPLTRAGAAAGAGALDAADVFLGGVGGATLASRAVRGALVGAVPNTFQAFAQGIGMGDAWTNEDNARNLGAQVAFGTGMGAAMGGTLGRGGRFAPLREGESPWPLTDAAQQRRVDRFQQQQAQRAGARPAAPPPPDPTSPQQPLPAAAQDLPPNQQQSLQLALGSPGLELEQLLALRRVMLDQGWPIEAVNTRIREIQARGEAEGDPLPDTIAPVTPYRPPGTQRWVKHEDQLLPALGYGSDISDPKEYGVYVGLPEGRMEVWRPGFFDSQPGLIEDVATGFMFPSLDSFHPLHRAPYPVETLNGQKGWISQKLSEGAGEDRQTRYVFWPSDAEGRPQTTAAPLVVPARQLKDFEEAAKNYELKEKAEKAERDAFLLQKRAKERFVKPSPVPSNEALLQGHAADSQATGKALEKRLSVQAPSGRITVEGVETTPTNAPVGRTMTLEEIEAELERLRAAQAGPRPTQKPLFGGRITEDQWRAFGAGPGTLPW